ncbi:MAG: hypothetical protein K9M94_03640 [Spirochaetia bacterium]|nr:hypothetical protein [Spirochaetia bacterium]
MNVVKQIVIIVVVVAVVSAAGYFVGRAHTVRPTMETDTELYQNTLDEIGKLRSEIDKNNKLIGRFIPELEEVAERIESSAKRIETSVEISEDIESGSSEIKSVAGELREDIADIDEASRGLAEIFGVTEKESKPMESGDTD